MDVCPECKKALVDMRSMLERYVFPVTTELQ